MEVHWLEQFEADVPAGGDWLGTNETHRLDAIRFAKRRADFRLGRWTAKCALRTYLHLPASLHELAAIEIRPSPLGAPEVFVASEPAAATISLSHRAGVALCAVVPPGAALGCDLELIEPRSDAFIADYFTAGEQSFIARASTDDRSRTAALLWSAKESALKALHEGLRLDTRSVEVTLDALALDPNAGIEHWLPLEVRYTGNKVFHGWWQHAGKFIRTLVADPPPSLPIHIQLPPTCACGAVLQAEHLS